FLHNPLARYEGFVTEVYKNGLIEPVKKLSQVGWKVDTWVFDGFVNAMGWATLLESKISELFDKYLIDGAVNAIPATIGGSAKRLRKVQSGSIQNYIMAMVVGVVILGVFSLIFM
ncbi:MAG: hypothetical protein ACE5FY_00990, partial [Nitrospiria bacterium]